MIAITNARPQTEFIAEMQVLLKKYMCILGRVNSGSVIYKLC